ncbi:hypothetical protein HPB47_003090 [Ixodes persulcatus]|uniref:Uncharacterized protein n=1 Tax=Ixodes persulcatus TaxID=34615 RepID=A0AC60PJE9_IXOPE|nr:hypothetical protein HPB47_003090 [Ixodes persulcatus]
MAVPRQEAMPIQVVPKVDAATPAPDPRYQPYHRHPAPVPSSHNHRRHLGPSHTRRTTTATWGILDQEGYPVAWSSSLPWKSQPHPLLTHPAAEIPEPFRGHTLLDRHPTEPPSLTPPMNTESSVPCAVCQKSTGPATAKNSIAPKSRRDEKYNHSKDNLTTASKTSSVFDLDDVTANDTDDDTGDDSNDGINDHPDYDSPSSATRSVRGDPHEISVELVARDGLKFRVQRAVCSCVAGTSECCKHAVAVLLYCNRTGIQRLEELSSTDKECTWRRTPGKELYGEPVPVKDFCHVKTQPAFPEPSPEEQREIQHQLMGASFNSALAKHSAPEPPRLDDRYRQVIERSEGSVLLARLAEIPTSPSGVCSAFYNKEVVVSVETAATLLHDTENNKAA